MIREEGVHSCSVLTRAPKGKEQYQETLEAKRILGAIPASEPKAGGTEASCRKRAQRCGWVWAGTGRGGRGGQLASLCHDCGRGLSQGKEFSSKASTHGTVAAEETE